MFRKLRLGYILNGHDQFPPKSKTAVFEMTSSRKKTKKG